MGGSTHNKIFHLPLRLNKTKSLEMKIQIISVLFLYIGCKYADAIRCYSCHSDNDDFCGDVDALVAKGDEAIMDCSKNPLPDYDYDRCYYSRTTIKGSDVVEYDRFCVGSFDL